jgi:hypothetical protein
MNNEVRIVNWFLVAKSLIKFTNDDKNYKLAENVLKANDFAAFPIAKGDSVEVAFQDSTITFLRKVQAPKVE